MNLGTAPKWAFTHKWSLLLLVGLFVVSGWAVRHFKRPGQMTVIESQAMDMTTMKPPLGSVPVATEFVTRRPFSAMVKYTGSVAPYNEQNIYPRVQGWLTNLSVYNGDKVTVGQTLAVLDSPDLQNKYAEAQSGHTAALKEIPVAQADLARMRAERSAAQREIAGATQDAAAAKARVTATQRGVTKAEKELKTAQANLTYWKAEIKRETSLLKSGAVSQQEFDSEQAQYVAAESEVGNKQAMVEEARADVEAMQAELGGKQIGIQVARDRAKAADAALSGATAIVSQKAASANMAGAARVTAATFNQYRQIRAPFAGVVTKRYLSPGVLVNPGTAILNIAQIDKVRLQANVAQQDLAAISIGAAVVARTLKGSGQTFRAVVTSVSPVADQASRTAVVEAIIPNSDHSLFPGDFVSLQIATSRSTDAITVPSTALATKEGRDAVWVTQRTASGGKTTYFCTMHPEVTSDKPGLCPKCNMKLDPKEATTGKTARLIYVTVGRSDGERTEIISGLNVGDEVIYAGQRYLREGDAITVTPWGKNGPAELPKPAGGGMESMPGMDMGGNGDSHDNMPGMDMSHKSSPPAARTKGAADKSPQLYTCPMHPEFITSDPKALCPKCNMKVEKMLKDAKKKGQEGTRP